MNTNSRPVIVKMEDRLIRYLCPKCKKPITFKKKYLGRSLCFKCGQRLDWSPVDNLSVEVIQAEDSDEAAWIAKEYYLANGMKEEDWIDITDFRNSLRGHGAELYLIFSNKQNYGKFMRKYAKEWLFMTDEKEEW